MAIVFESLAFSLVAVFVTKRMRSNSLISVGTGVLAGFISAVAYVYFAVYATHSPILARLGIESIGEFVTGNAVVQAVFFGILLPVGCLIGEKLAQVRLPALSRRPVYYATSTAVVAFCWGISALAVMAGL